MKSSDPTGASHAGPSDDETIAVFVTAARAAAQPPTAAQTHAHGRALDAKLDAESALQRRSWRPAQVAAVACSAALVAGVVVTERHHRIARADARSSAAASEPPPALAPAPARVVRPEPTAPAGAVDPVTAEQRMVPAAHRSAPPAARGWRATQTALVDVGDPLGAARVAIAALAHDASAAPVVSQLLRSEGALFDAVEGQLAALHGADATKLLCEQRLLRRRDRTAVDACRAFAREHPDHPGARTLAFAAARLAEDELLDLSTAEEEYSRAVLLSPIAGLPVTDALIARARVRQQLGELDEARADLRVVLEQDPAAAAQPDLVALARKLGMLPDAP